MITDLSALVPVPRYQEQRQHLFPSKSSLDWQIRQHRDELVRCGALLMINGRWFAHPDQFDACVLAIGAKAAKRHAGASQ